MKKLIMLGVLAVALLITGAPFPECTNCAQSAELHVPIIIDGVVKA